MRVKFSMMLACFSTQLAVAVVMKVEDIYNAILVTVNQTLDNGNSHVDQCYDVLRGRGCHAFGVIPLKSRSDPSIRRNEFASDFEVDFLLADLILDVTMICLR